MVATLAEETKNPAKDIPLGLIGSMSAIIIVYTVMALVLVMMQKYSDLDPNAAYSIAFASVGMKWAKYIVAFGALKGMTTEIAGRRIVDAQARATRPQIAQGAHDPPFTSLPSKTGTPKVYPPRCSSPNSPAPSSLLLPACMLAASDVHRIKHTASSSCCMRRRPLLVRRPSLSIATNLFLMGSLGYQAYVRFAICTVFMLVYYVFVGVHATYDMIQQRKEEKVDGVNLEDGNKERSFRG
ncbi:LOW QUALITY PROTEIN: cationic amino acid transporter 5-like [Asparagus officinalis]|uniref:LOW QUALITY PROTEIN: cationic amino acid transporter 5-like n=1 Tax=Asparagus officinalis TaxID=4686 RepID=UPI00098E8356|nr:LOW QUALITY PROTEIN: cationic amino acid transporter 5-like [Asparagus officinalis]